MSKKTEKPKDKASEQVTLELGQFYFLNGKFTEAKEEFLKVIEFDKGNAEAYYNLGLVYESIGEVRNAKDMFDQTLRLNPTHNLAKEHLAKLVGIK